MTCKNCKWWLRSSASFPTSGMCLASKHGNSKKMRSGCGLTTTEDFSCSEFKEKVEKKENNNE